METSLFTLEFSNCICGVIILRSVCLSMRLERVQNVHVDRVLVTRRTSEEAQLRSGGRGHGGKQRRSASATE